MIKFVRLTHPSIHYEDGGKSDSKLCVLTPVWASSPNGRRVKNNRDPWYVMGIDETLSCRLEWALSGGEDV